MSRIQKIINLQAAHAALENLAAWDYKVHAFSDIHFRINGRLDIWPSTRKYYDTRNHQKGEYDELETFVKKFLPLK